MNLQELQETKKTIVVKRALKEHYEINMDFDSFSLSKTHTMLKRVRSLLGESKIGSSTYESHKNSSYLKLIMLEQALVDRLNDLRKPNYRLIAENEEVQKSQVILAAQDMADTLQKMLEEISKMNVEELNAVVDGIKNEFGTSQGDTFNSSVSTALTGLQQAITSTKDTVTGALAAITGEDSGMEMPGVPGAELDTPMAGSEEVVDVEDEIESPELPQTPDEEEPLDTSGAGRDRR